MIALGANIAALPAAATAPAPLTAVWRDASFADFAAGTFDAAGANLYVSKKGVLQTIRRYDIDQNGAPDIVFDSSHDFAYALPATVYAGGKAGLSAKPILHLPTNSAEAAVVAADSAGRPLVLLLGGFNGTWNGSGLRVYRWGAHGLSETPLATLFGGLTVTGAAFGKDAGGRSVFAVATISGKSLPKTPTSETSVRIYAGVPAAPGVKPAFVLTLPPSDATSLAIANGYLYAASGGKVTRFSLDLSAGAQTPSGTPLPGTGVQKIVAAKLPGSETTGLLYVRGPGKSLQWLPDADPSSTPADLPVTGAVAAAAADFNGDGRTDLAVVTEKTITVLAADPAGGTFHKTAELPAPYGSAVALGDWNGDGRPDIAVACGRSALFFHANSYVYWNDGGANGFSAAHRTAIPTEGATDVASGNFIGGHGGVDDLLFVNSTRGELEGRVPSYLYYATKGKRTFRRQELPTIDAYEAKVADFDDDGYNDLLIVCLNDSVIKAVKGAYLFRGGPKGLDTKHPLLLPTQDGLSAGIADFNHDGYLDIAFSEVGQKGVRIWWGGPKGITPLHATTLHTPDHDDPRFIAVADFNRDGWLDIAVPDMYKTTSVLYWGGPKGFDSSRRQILPALGSCTAETADLNGDGWPDLILTSWWDPLKKTHYSPTYIYWGGPKGFSPARRTDLPMNCAEDCSVADLNKDGHLDLLFTCYEADTYRSLDSFIYWGGKDGGYSPQRRTRLFNDSGSGNLIADFDGDGWLDIAIANHTKDGDHRANSRVWWGGPKGFRADNVTMLPTLGPHLMYGADPGNILTRKPEEAFVSRVYARPAGLRPAHLAWDADTPPGTAVTVQLRSAASPEALQKAAWIGPKGAGSIFTKSGASLRRLGLSGRYLQYRLVLHTGAAGGSPRVHAVKVAFGRQKK